MRRNSARLVLAIGLLGLLMGAPGCSEEGAAGATEVVDAPAAAPRPGGRVGTRYWAEASPRRGTLSLYSLHEGNVIHRVEAFASALNFDLDHAVPCDLASGTCTGTDGRIDAFTDPDRVTFIQDPQGVDDGNSADDTCYRNGAVLEKDPTCGGIYQLGAACTRHNVFCGPVRLTSHITFGRAVGALPDVVLDVGNVPGGTSIAGCPSNNTFGGPGGLCGDDGPAKIDPRTSNFTPSIPGSNGLGACTYCYGNKSIATETNRPALVDALISGDSSEKAAANTNTMALFLASPDDFDLVMTVYYAEPAVDAPGEQITYQAADGTTASCFRADESMSVVVSGSGFGPPSDCIAETLPENCPATGPPATGYGVELAGASVEGALSWSDPKVVSVPSPSGFYAACPVTVTTPVGSVNSDDEVVACPDQYREFAPAALGPRTRFASGVLGDFVVVAGGLTLAEAGNGSSAIEVMPLPRCADPSPRFVTLADTLPSGVGRHSQAATVAAGGLYIIGGASNATTCSNRVVRLEYDGGPSGALTNEANLPRALCQATAITLFDQVNGKEYIVVTGGTLRPLPRPAGTPAPSAADLAPRATYVYDVAADTWTTFGTMGVRRYNMAGVGFRDTAPANHVGVFAGGVSTVTTGSESAVATVNAVILTDGVPFVFGVAPLPAARSGTALALASGQIYAYGGAENASLVAAGRHSLFRIDPRTMVEGATWTTLTASGADGRQGHALVLSNFDEPTFTDLVRVLSIGGNDATTLSTTAREYIP